MKYNWQQNYWPEFNFDPNKIEDTILLFMEKTGRVDGLLSALPESLQTETIIDIMVSEAIKSSAIEGEFISRSDVMSSIKTNLGLNANTKQIHDLRAAGIAELMVCMREGYSAPLNKAMLLNLDEMLMKGSFRINRGAWRTHSEPMLIVSGTLGSECVHYEAPPSKQVPNEMKQFIKWFNDTEPGKKSEIRLAPVRSAITHLYFESIHPFEDGNGRIGRTLAEKALSQGIGRPVLISLSESIESNRDDYYKALKQAQRSLDITDWILWFSKMLLDAQKQAESKIEFSLKKTKLFDRIGELLNPRQLSVIQRMLKEGDTGFKGGMSAKKYITIAKTTKATATRDLQDLVRKNIFSTENAGRSTRYRLIF
jgi:Fic family protein